MANHKVTVTVNGAPRQADVESRLLLVHLLREEFRMTGTHIGCDTTHCGACTVLLDGVPVKSCTVLAVQADGRNVMTVEGLEQDGKLHPIQEGFVQEHGLQCGFCTPGMMLTGYALLQASKNPDEG
ncbi:MAG: (2Fe-2S)-binding protein, partial [Solirubrobacterales bacterium]